MRLLVICLTLGILLWQTTQTNEPNLLTLVGFITATGLTLMRFCRRLLLPAASGALLGGVTLGYLQMIPAAFLTFTLHINEIALGWIGLFMGAGITPKILANKRLVQGALCFYTPPTIAIFMFFIFQDAPLITTIPIALLAGTSVILFVPPNSKVMGEIIPIGKLTTGLGLLLWMSFTLTSESIWPAASGGEILLEVVVYLTLLEATVQVSKHTKTSVAQQLTFISLAYLLALSTQNREISTFFLAFPAGIYLSFRKVHGPLLGAKPLSDAIVSFTLVFLALTIFSASPSPSSFDHTVFVGLYFTTLIVSKIAGGLLAHRLFNFPTPVWLALLPQGFVAIFCLHQTPNTLFSAHETLHTTVLIAFICLTVLHPAMHAFWSKIRKDPLVRHRPS